VLPNPSGLNASWSLDRIAGEFGRLRVAAARRLAEMGQSG
jgi:TDG/mug DNA glycosylase family protein